MKNLEFKDIPSLIRNLTKEQRKIIYIAAILVVLFLLFTFFAYIPQAKKLAALGNNIVETDTQIEQIMSVAKGRDLANVVKELKVNLAKTLDKFPFGEDIVVAKLSEIAEDNIKLTVRGIAPSARQPLPEKIMGKSIDEVFITMDITGDYKAIGEFLDMVRGDFPVFLRIREIDISGQGEGKSNLDCTIQFSAYLRNKS